jgi:hypothetical protein
LVSRCASSSSGFISLLEQLSKADVETRELLRKLAMGKDTLEDQAVHISVEGCHGHHHTQPTHIGASSCAWPASSSEEAAVFASAWDGAGTSQQAASPANRVYGSVV